MNDEIRIYTHVGQIYLDLDGSLEDAMYKLKDHMDGIPEEYQSSAYIEFDAGEGTYEISFLRPQTDHEVQLAKANEDTLRDTRKEINELESRLDSLKKSVGEF